MRVVYLIAASVMFATQAVAAGEPQMTSWDAEQNGSPKTYTFGTYKLTLSSAKNGDQMGVPHLSVSAPGLPPFAYDGQAAGDIARADFTVLKLSPKVQPSVVFDTYSGGAHCCVEVVVIQPAGKSWRKIDLGSWDGGGIAYPKDVDGDDIVDFVFVDNAFLYAFDCYACSHPPPLVLNIVNGKAVNVSTAPRFASLFRADMAEAKQGCAEHNNGVCAGYVADAARLGEFDEAWQFMLANYNKTSTWDYPTRCQGQKVDYRCQGTELKPKDYPEALKWFLQDNGYVPK
ncbi:MAG TPA: hypothetical protein VMS78_01400 [Rhizomicrobium sp.]|nr:hypothetical protein [Rhizomicrobium sp.]